MEVVGGIASALQLANVALQGLIKIHGIARDMKETPKRLRDVLFDLENFAHLLDNLEREASQPPSRFAKAPEWQTQSLVVSLQSTATCADGLQANLRRILSDPTDSKLKRTWRAFATLSQERDIITQCDRLHRLKQDIQLNLQNIGVSLISSVTVSLGETRSLNGTSSSDSTLDVVSTRLAAIEQSNNRIEEIAQALHRLVLSKDSAEQHVGATSLVDQHAGSMSSIQANPIDMRTAAIECCSQLARYPADLVTAIHNPGFKERSLSEEYNTTGRGISPETLCSCTRKKTVSSVSFGPFESQWVDTTLHDHSCPIFSPLKSRTNIAMKLRLRPFIYRTAELIFQASSGSGGFSLSQSLKSYNIVKRQHSPAFQLFERLNIQLIQELLHRKKHAQGHRFRQGLMHNRLHREWFGRGLELQPEPTTTVATSTSTYTTSSLESLHEELMYIFESGLSQPTDTDEFGSTLMHELTITWTWLNHNSSDNLRNAFQNLATFLFQKGVSLTSKAPIYRAHFYDGTRKELHYTPSPSFYTSAVEIAYYAMFNQPEIESRGEMRNIPHYLQSPIPYNILSEMGVEPDWFTIYRHSKTIFEIVHQRSCLVDLASLPISRDILKDFELTPLHHAVLQRSMERVIPLMKKDTAKAERSTWYGPLSVVECAFGWCEGLKLLSAAGYPADNALELAVFRKDVNMLKILLDESDLSSGDILRHALCLTCGDIYSGCHERRGRHVWPDESIQQEIMDLFIQALQSRRRQLRELAVTKLPAAVFRSLELDKSESIYLDEHAREAAQLLEDCGIEIPMPLRPGDQPLFHSFNLACPEGGVQLAERLFNAGFQQVNALGGRLAETPLQILSKRFFTWSDSRVPAMKWLVDHGAITDVDGAFEFGHESKPLLHVLAKKYNGFHGTSWDWWIEDFTDTGIKDEWLTDVYWRDTAIKKLSRADAVRQRVQLDEPSLRARTELLRAVVLKTARLEDECNCYCSSSGCLPISKLPILFWFREGKRGLRKFIKNWEEIQEDLFRWMSDTEFFDPEQTLHTCSGGVHLYIKEFVRREIFERLGMAHTCCNYRDGTQSDIINDGPEPISQDTRQELQEEDAEAKEQLYLFIQAFNRHSTSTQSSDKPIREVLGSWWDIVDEILPPLLPWERGLRYCTLWFEMPTKLVNKLDDLSAEKHRDALEKAGYRCDMDFVEIVKHHLGKRFGPLDGH